MNLVSPITKFSGPPGTGKTTKQLDIVMRLLEEVPPERIIFTTYTRAGAYEARDRACERFNLSPDSFRYFTTIHALCYRHIGKQSVLGRPDMQYIGEKLGLKFTWQNPFAEGQLRLNLKGDHFVQMHTLARMTRRPIAEVHRDYSGIHVPFSEIERFVKFYDDYRKHYNKIDFTDMLEKFIESDTVIDADYLIVDEAQDLSRIQWEVIEKLSQSVKHTYISGDDDQCIHVWAGADPNILIELKGDHIVLPQSYRIPPSVHELAEKVIQRVPVRIQKTYRPRKGEGKVVALPSVDSIPLEKEGTWLLLCRNRLFGDRFAQACVKRAVLFSGMGDPVREEAQRAIVYWNQLTNGGVISGAEAKIIYRFLKNRDRVKHGSKTKLTKEVEDHEPIDITRLRSDFGLLCSGKWEEAFFNMKPELKAFFLSSEKNNCLDEMPRVRISTIHGAKGQEADNVAIIPDMSWRTWSAYHHDRDNEHRVFYVAVTRARHNLFLIRPETDKYYEF